jgi:hypothetical protein
MESLPYISNPASAGLQLAAGSFKYEWFVFYIDQGLNLPVYTSPHWLLDQPTGAFYFTFHKN